MFEQTATTAHSKFHTEKAEVNPAIFHAEGSSNGYEQARHAIERDLKHVMRSHTGQEGSVTYSIHYSDVNGLSKLENYILGLEIGKYFGKSLIHPFIVVCAFLYELWGIFRHSSCSQLLSDQVSRLLQVLSLRECFPQQLNILGLDDKC